MNFKNPKYKKWFLLLGNKFTIILILFIGWMVFFDANNYFIHKELSDDIDALEQTRDNYHTEITKDKNFLEKMENETEMEKFAREKYYLKKENEDIYIIEHEDSIK